MAGTEAFVFAPWALEVAALVDLFGSAFFTIIVVGYFRLSLGQSLEIVKGLWIQLSAFIHALAQWPGSAYLKISATWRYHLFVAEKRARQILAWSATVSSFAAIIGFTLTKAATLLAH